jgi:hypothetical protein
LGLGVVVFRGRVARSTTQVLSRSGLERRQTPYGVPETVASRPLRRGAAGVVLALPSLIAFYPPLGDLPYHKAAIGILRRFGDPSMFPPGLYRRNLGEPNQLFHMVGWALSHLMSSRWAVKLRVTRR